MTVPKGSHLRGNAHEDIIWSCLRYGLETAFLTVVVLLSSDVL